MTTTPPTMSGPLDDLPDDLGAGRGPAWLDRFLSQRLGEVVAARRQIHSRPEIAHDEVRTTALIHSALAREGIASTTLPTGTGVIAEIGTAGPVIALRADIDALPLTEESGLPYASTIDGVSHGCGHDVHTAVVLGAGLALAASPTPLPVRVRLLFQPAEEAMPGGSHALVAAGAMEHLERIFAVHCDPRLATGRIGLRTGPITSAVDVITVEVTGPGGHTSRPHLTADVVGALADVAAHLPQALARHLDPRSGATLVWGSVHAGETFNVIPRRGRLSGTLRVLDRQAWDAAEPLVRQLVGQILAPTGVEHDLVYVRGVPPVDNDPVAVALQHQAVVGALGPEAVFDADQSMGAEDFAVLLDHAPGALARLGVWDGRGDPVDLHSSRFIADERAIPVGIRVLVHTVLAAARSASVAGRRDLAVATEGT